MTVTYARFSQNYILGILSMGYLEDRNSVIVKTDHQ